MKEIDSKDLYKSISYFAELEIYKINRKIIRDLFELAGCVLEDDKNRWEYEGGKIIDG